jgi:type VI secretion system protein ImpA
LASPATIPLEALLAPVSEDEPAGTNIRLDSSPTSVYYRLKDARSGARMEERRAEADGGIPGLSADWQTILSLAAEVLAERSKDLELAAWLTEALVRARGFAGLRDGVRLLRGFIEQYWDTFWSLEDEEGLETRLAPLAGLNGEGAEGTLIQPLRTVPVTARGDLGALAAYHYDQAWALGQVGDEEVRARREAAGEITMGQFMAAVNASGGEFYVSLLADMAEALAEIDALRAALDERAGREAPSVSDIRGVVTMVHDTVRGFSKDLVARTAGPDETADGGGEAPAGSADSFGALGGVRGREEALRTLTQVADYFRRYEPHSPISTSLDELVRRARMPFPELLAELLPDPTAWRSALTSAGIKPPAE